MNYRVPPARPRVSIRIGAPAVSIVGLLGVAFVVLKLTGVIAWSWWWVLLPFWGSAALVLIAALLAMLVIVLALEGKS